MKRCCIIFSALLQVAGSQEAAADVFAELPGPNFPGDTAAASNAAWPSGQQPARLAAWPKNSDGSLQTCWKTSVIHDTATGWPGKCLNLESTDAASEVDCRETCVQ